MHLRERKSEKKGGMNTFLAVGTFLNGCLSLLLFPAFYSHFKGSQLDKFNLVESTKETALERAVTSWPFSCQ